MALSCKVVSITSPASTGNQAYDGFGFEPKFAAFFSADPTHPTLTLGRVFFGAASGASAQRAVSIQARDGNASSVTARIIDTSHAVYMIPTAAETTVSASLVSFDSDGLTLNWDEVGAGQLGVTIVALGGDDFDEAVVSGFTPSAGTGNQAVTGVGIDTPDLVMFFGGLTSGVTAILGLGCMTASGDQWAVMVNDEDGQATTDSRRWQRTDRCYGATFATDEPNQQLAYVSMDADGFTVNRVNNNTNPVNYVAIKLGANGRVKAGSLTQETTTGVTAYTAPSFPVSGLLLASFCDAATTSGVAHARLAIGAASGPTDRAASWFGSADNVADSVVDSLNTTSAVLTMQTEGTPAEDVRIDLDQFTSVGFDLDYEVVDATAREVLYLAFGSLGGGVSAKPWLYRSHTQTIVAGYATRH